MSKARNMARMGQDTSAGYTGAFDMPAGTTAERPVNAGLGWTRLNTDTGSVEVYDGTNWNAVTRPFITSVTGTIYAGATSNLVIAGQNFTSTITVRFLEGGSTVADVTGVSVSSGSATVAVPAAVYGQTAGDLIEVKIMNSDGTMSANGITKTVQALPTGGTITTSGGYRYHTFTSSSSLVAPSGFSISADYLVVAGGGGSGNSIGGGGGAGGVVSGTLSIVAGTTYSVTIGAGGSGSTTDYLPGSSGQNSTLQTVTSAIGGGGGGGNPSTGNAPFSGGSGGGGGSSSATGASGAAGTAGQGFAGGNGGTYNGGGGGGAGAVGGSVSGTSNAGAGGVGTGAFSAWASATSTGASGYYAGGGGGGVYNSNGPGGAGGLGGGGAGSTDNGTAGTANTGGGAGAGGYNATTKDGANGGSGIVIVRYAL